MDTIVKFLPNAILKRADSKDTYQFIGSTEDPDRDGDVIRLDGWDTAAYEKNPIVFYGHDYHGANVKFPIGTATVVKDEANRRLLFTITFTDAHVDAQTVRALVDEGVLRACSVGFIAKEGGVNLIVNPDTGNVIGREFNGQSLLELSIVPLPANPNAVRLALEKGVCTEVIAKAWGLMEPEADDPRVTKIEAEMKALLGRLNLMELEVAKHVKKVADIVPVIVAGGESSTAVEEPSAFYADLLTVGRSLADYLNPTETEVERMAKETAALFKS